MGKLLILLTRLFQIFATSKAQKREETIPSIPELPKNEESQEQPMKLGTEGLELIKEHEGLRLKAYLCQAGIPTIGYGHTKGVKLGDTTTAEQAEAWLKEDVSDSENGVNSLVKITITQNQFDALVSFVFNLGSGAFGSSTLLKKLNSGDYSAAADQFLVWNKVRVNGKLQISNGLKRRRKAERELFLKV